MNTTNNVPFTFKFPKEDVLRRTPRKFDFSLYKIINEQDQSLITSVISVAYVPCEDSELSQPTYDIKTPDTNTNNPIKEYKILVVYPVRIQMLDGASINRVLMVNELHVYDPVYGNAEALCKKFGFAYEQEYNKRTGIVVTVRSSTSEPVYLREEVMVIVKTLAVNKMKKIEVKTQEEIKEEKDKRPKVQNLQPKKTLLSRLWPGSVNVPAPAVDEVEDIDEDDDEDENGQPFRKKRKLNNPEGGFF